jgi:hypothetical protein
MAGSAPVPAGAAPVACTGALWGCCRALAEAQRMVGYLASKIAREQGVGVGEVIENARSASKQREVTP